MSKTKKVSVRRASENDPAYLTAEKLILEHHPDLVEAKVVLLYNTAWSVDPGGRVVLGKCKIASAADRALVGEVDVIVTLNAAFWFDEQTSSEQREALLDHELCHAHLQYDGEGEPVQDELGRLVFKLRHHDVEEFEDVIKRHGTYKRDLERFAAALLTQREIEKLGGEPK